MSYSLCIPIDHGTAGLTLLAALTAPDGTPHATVRDLAVTEIAQGFYQLTTALIPDSYRGTVVIYTDTLGIDADWTGVTIASVAGINPQETEHSDVKTSGIPTADEIFAAVLKGDMSTITGEAARSPLNALRFLRNKWSISGSTLTVTKEDDATEAWTAAVTTSAGADPIVGNDPA